MANFRTRKDFVIGLQVLKKNLNNEDYTYVTNMMRSLKHGMYGGYDIGYDSRFEDDIFFVKSKKRTDNVYDIRKKIKLCTKPV